MSTPTPAAPAAPAAPVSTEPKSFGVSLTADGGAVMRITALRRKNGSASTFVTVYDGKKDAKGKKTGQRGATQAHASMSAARTAVDSLVAQATSKGWSTRRSGGGFKSRADAFDPKNLPAPAKASKK